MFQHLEAILKGEGAIYEVVAPHSGEVKSDKGSTVTVDEKIDGGPSVFFDAVAILPSNEGVQTLMEIPNAVTFVGDAFNHMKFIGYVDEAMPLLEKAGISEMLDNGCQLLKDGETMTEFMSKCRDSRYWQRAS